MRSIGIRLGIIAAIVVGAFLIRPFLTGNAGSLSVGDCFDTPAGEAQTVEDVQHHPCTDAHTAEVIFVGNYAPVTDAYPADAEFFTFVRDNCGPAFNTYTGLDFTSDPTYDMSAFTPTQEGWTGGDHKVICFAIRQDEGPIGQSLKKS